MWGNIYGVVGAAIQKVQKIQDEIESQMDAAVGNDTATSKLTEDASEQPLSHTTETSFASSPEVHEDEIPEDFNAKISSETNNEMPSFADSATPTDLITIDEATLRSKIDEATSILSKKTKRLEENNGKLKKALETEKKSRETEITQLSLTHGNEKAKINSEWENQISTLKIAYEREFQALQATITREEDEHQKIINSLRAELAALSSTTGSQQADNDRFNAETISLRTEMASLRSQNDTFQEENKSLKRDIESLTITLKEANHKHEVLTADIASIQSQSARALDLKNSEFQSEMEKLQKSHDDRVASIQKDLTAAEKRIEKQKNRIQELNKKHEALTVEVVGLRASVSSTSIEASESKSTDTSDWSRKEAEHIARIAELTGEVEQLRSRLNDCQDSEQQSREALTDLKDRNQYEMQQLTEKLEKSETEVKKLRDMIEESEKQQESLRRDSSSQLATIESERLRLEQALLDREKQVESLTRHISEAETKENSLQGQLDESRQRVKALEGDSDESKVLVDTVAREIKECRERLAKSESETRQLLEAVGEKERIIEALQSDISDRDTKLKQLQSMSQNSANSEVELKKTLQKTMEESREKDQRLAAFELEGSNLAKKQSEMEKMVRKCKNDVRDRDNEIKSLRESKESLVKTIEEMQESQRSLEADRQNAGKSLTALQAVSGAAADRIGKLESEVNSKSEEIVAQKRALEQAWSEVSELKRSLVDMKVERENMKRQIGEETSRFAEHEHQAKEMETREAVLRATHRQLQESLQRTMQESSLREEKLREDLHEMRKRWQDAISQREALASEISSATGPLLRQISSLQESLRMKSESFQAVETSLNERALRAESQVELFDMKKHMLEESVAVLRAENSTLTQRNTELRHELQSIEIAMEKLKKSETLMLERLNDMETQVKTESSQKFHLQNSIREFESKQRLEMQTLKESAENAKRNFESQLQSARSEAQQLKEELNSFKNGSISNNGTTAALSANSVNGNNGSNKPKLVTNGVLPSGETSFVFSERVQQLLQQREEDIASLNQQLRMMQASRDALLEEVSYLSSRNVTLEQQSKDFPEMKEGLQSLKKKNELLLTMLGEKEEELESLLTDMKDIKDLYREQIESLMMQVAPPTSSA